MPTYTSNNDRLVLSIVIGLRFDGKKGFANDAFLIGHHDQLVEVTTLDEAPVPALQNALLTSYAKLKFH